MATTYEPIATTTLSSAASTITFSSIASSWTDLRLVFVVSATSAGIYPRFNFNNDTSTNYSSTRLYGDGTSAASQANTSTNRLSPLAVSDVSTSQFNLLSMNIFSYAGSTNKTVLMEGNADNNGSGTVERSVGLWRSTSAIYRIDIISGTSTFTSGTTATLYGIKAA